ncbi:phospholipid N-methyltransferase PmtA [Pseudohoeflea coraliihabitans]|uniref:Methyltransferase domain-containing protein n=1 Tax=Pseudohoeflea coraliihabitans TaxID=2860393 RepID=A0ABS6WSY4_9HYPH|nr:class I SAM-dependent methyltransferase [Pseudohoeflea sp. DP4N28-3]MBW3099071.1 methyltransferase domain-containing protein [Pseudohoeflea sp. DP4N28-3]
MKTNISDRLVRKFDDEIRFFRGWLDGPKAVGAIVPTSQFTARSMASLADPHSSLPVLELGPGTGAITRAILGRGIAPERLYSVEYSGEFYEHLKLEYPEVNVIRGDAFDLETALGDNGRMQFDCVISAVPLLNFPMEQRIALVEGLLDRMPPGRPVVQISYGPVSPVASRGSSFTVAHHEFVLRNLPPAQLWTYRRTAPL